MSGKLLDRKTYRPLLLGLGYYRLTATIMKENLEELLHRIKNWMPNLEVEQIEINQEGLVNDVVIVNQELVFRFAKNENSARLLSQEIKILNFLQSKLDIEIPNPIDYDQESVVYHYLKGKPLLRETIINQDQETQMVLANQIGNILNQLHKIDLTGINWGIPSTQAAVTRERWIELQSKVEQHLYPLFLPHQIQWAEGLFEGILCDTVTSEYHAVLIHGDLAPYHILYDGQKKRVTGVLDFGVSGLGDPALDIGNLISSYGESFVSKAQNTYPEIDTYLPRARFYAQSVELEWVLNGLESGEKFWFTAHLGGARDLQG
jgi:aminoglycoside 2''-phosphotransferase